VGVHLAVHITELRGPEAQASEPHGVEHVEELAPELQVQGGRRGRFQGCAPLAKLKQPLSAAVDTPVPECNCYLLGCPCGFYNDATRECRCTPAIIARYVAKISGPLVDRIDIHVEVPAVKYGELRGGEAEKSARIRERAIRARETQLERFKGTSLYCNAQMSTRHVRQHGTIDAAGERLLETAIARLGLSARAHDRVLKVARTIADLDGASQIQTRHLAEAVQYRSLDRAYWC